MGARPHPQAKRPGLTTRAIPKVGVKAPTHPHLIQKKRMADAIEQDKLPSSFEEGKIYFVKYSTEDKYNSFYRHLRNAFAHYHINHSSNYYIMNDYSDDAGTKKTMIGKILCQDLKDLTDLFYKQREISDANY